MFMLLGKFSELKESEITASSVFTRKLEISEQAADSLYVLLDNLTARFHCRD